MLCLLKLFITTIDFCLFTSNYRKVQGTVASWLVPLSPWSVPLSRIHSAVLQIGVNCATCYFYSPKPVETYIRTMLWT